LLEEEEELSQSVGPGDQPDVEEDLAKS